MAQVTIIGTGLIGTSLGLALRASTLRNLTVVGTDAEHSARAGASRRQAFHRVENRLGNAIDDADIIILATPVLAMRDLMAGMSPYLPEGCVVTDVGSTKGQVLQWADELLPGTVDFVGGHPMAGRETPGPEARRGNPFRRQALLRHSQPQSQPARRRRNHYPGRGRGRQALFHRR